MGTRAPEQPRPRRPQLAFVPGLAVCDRRRTVDDRLRLPLATGQPTGAGKRFWVFTNQVVHETNLIVFFNLALLVIALLFAYTTVVIFMVILFSLDLSLLRCTGRSCVAITGPAASIRCTPV